MLQWKTLFFACIFLRESEDVERGRRERNQMKSEEWGFVLAALENLD
jgi:hypothetical protein